jgi:hypothetical protein
MICSICGAKPGDRCDFDAGTGWEPTIGQYHQARIQDAMLIGLTPPMGDNR